MKFWIVAIVAVLALLSSVHAATFTVNDTTDAVDANPGDGNCLVAPAGCSLRAAIQEANALPGPDTITVPSGVFELTRTGVETPSDPAAVTDLDVTDDVTITGAGASATIVDAKGTGRVFDVASSATIVGLTIRGGDEVDGGGLLVLPDTTLSLTVRDVQITGNKAAHGGALFVDGGAVVLLERVSITGNTGTTSGGTAEITAGGGTVTLRNATVSGNVSGQTDLVNGGELTLDHVTFVASTIGGSIDVAAGTTTIRGSILDAGATGVVCGAGTFVSQGANLEHGTSCGFAMIADVSATDPALGPLQDNGGGTLTHAIAATSPAVDAAGSCPPPSDDQRGTARPLDGDGDQVAACDVGAFELDPLAVTTTTTSTAMSTTTVPSACAPEASFVSVRCRVAALAGGVSAAAAPGRVSTSLVGLLGKAGERVGAAESAASPRKTRRLLRKAAALVAKVFTKMGTKAGRAALPDVTVRGPLQFEADAIRTVILELAG